MEIIYMTSLALATASFVLQMIILWNPSIRKFKELSLFQKDNYKVVVTTSENN